MSTSPTVGPMLKISLSLKTNEKTTDAAAGASPSSFGFIFGIGTDGLSAFEKDLFGKAVGDTVSIRVEPDTMLAYFDHLLCPLMECVTIPSPTELEVGIEAVKPVSDREIIKAMAQKASGCDSDCDCGCGC